MALGWLEIAIVGLLLILPILWNSNHKVRYYSKIVLYFAMMMLTGVVVLPFVCWRPKHPKNIIVVRDLWNYTLQIFQWEVEVRDRQNVEYMKPGVIVSNHQSALDMIPMMQALPHRTTALAKKELLYTGFWGLAAWFCGLVFVDRLNPDRARETMNRTVKEIHDRNVKLWVFPEGTRKLNGKINEFKKGAFYLAVQAQVPIIPIVNSSYETFYDPKGKIFNPGKIITTCLPPVSTKGLTSDDVSRLTEDVRQQMSVVFEKTSKEIREGHAKS